MKRQKDEMSTGSKPTAIVRGSRKFQSRKTSPQRVRGGQGEREKEKGEAEPAEERKKSIV